MKVFVIDVARCVGCRNCQIACKDEHCGNDWLPYARPQPETRQFWCQVNENVRGTVPKVKISYVTRLCMHCDVAVCIPACPVEGGIYKRVDGLVIIDPKKCTGCMKCVKACPYGCIYYNEDLKIAQKCTGCTHLLDRGWPIKEPRCVDACATGAIKFGEETEFSELIRKAEVLNPEYRTEPRVHYLSLPKRFIAGTVYDPVEKEVITGANCTLTGEGGIFSTITDGFGDFWFEGLKAGMFSLKIEAAGFALKTIDAISTKQDINLGDIPL
jgi:tetrathionate reductase subunit B